MSGPDPRNHGGFFVAAATPRWTCYDGITWPPCRCAKCIITYTGRRLARQYGRDRAMEILAGRDEIANADLAAWNAVGTRNADRAA